MYFSIAPTNFLPLRDQPTRISVRLSRDLLKSIDPSMEPLMEEDSASRVRRKGKPAIDQMARDVSTALFGTEVPRQQVSFVWSKHVTGSGDTGYLRTNHYVGIFFDHRITTENASPRVLELTADDEVDGTIVFRAVELDAEESDFVNKVCNEAEH
ncbi:hypothetical protein diail_8735 [Diaporthe ilicicola]|nr:hypothetical protein diail_8735 [Diaporthe ilicicola]